MKPFITIAVQCHNFQRRFSWMLSSLAQQSIASRLVVDVAFMPGNGTPPTEEVCGLFRSRLEIRQRPWTDFETFQLRGVIRNEQLKECSTEWLMFGDCDMVYHPNYFADLEAELSKNHRTASYMISSGRISNPVDDTNRLVDSQVWKCAKEIPNAFTLADSLPKREMRNVGAGFCQIINTVHAPHGGYYVDPKLNRDWSWRRGSNPKSDMQFRRRISQCGGHRRGLPAWFTAKAIHLNHNRDPEAGCHITEQR